MPNTPIKMKNTSLLERMYWIAGILSAIVAVAALMRPVWLYLKSTADVPSTPSASAVNSGNRSIIIQGSGNVVVAPQNATAETRSAGRFIDIEISDHVLDLQGKSRHEVHFPQISGKIPHDVLERINHFLRRSAETEYERYENIDEVQISYEIGLKEFNLLGINFEIFASGDQAAHPITSTSATTLDLETGSPLYLKDFFRPGYIGEINEFVRSALVNQNKYYPCEKSMGGGANDNAVSLVLEGITGHRADACFKSVSEGSQYYLTDTSVVLVFPKYSIAPGVDGDIEIPIHFKELGNILKSNGPLQRFL
ncbi:RsiV family protein [Paraburkholderia denitrificans]|uniref:RsiV family protein n=1 Tax=Paraburkholderia denitrificans TaxID=694025 RepID=A0ABW0JF37_9BURK